jgi:hypothetical protein
MNEVTKAIESIRSSVERVGKSGRDTVYLDNVSFRASVTKFQVPDGTNLAEAREDFRWFMMCEDLRDLVPHPCPEKSWWLRQFGKDAPPYGITWDLGRVEDALTTPGLERRAVLLNPLVPDPACILCYQFQVVDHTTGGPHLDVTVTMRSSDVVNCLPQDAAMTELLLHHLAQKLDMIPGRMTFNIANAHIYWEDLDTWDEGVIDMPL